MKENSLVFVFLQWEQIPDFVFTKKQTPPFGGHPRQGGQKPNRVWKGKKDKHSQMSNITGDDGSFSSGNTGEEVQQQQQPQNHLHGSGLGPNSSTVTNSNGSSSSQQQQQQQQQQPIKKKRNLPGTPGKSKRPMNSIMFFFFLVPKISCFNELLFCQFWLFSKQYAGLWLRLLSLHVMSGWLTLIWFRTTAKLGRWIFFNLFPLFSFRKREVKLMGFLKRKFSFWRVQLLDWDCNNCWWLLAGSHFSSLFLFQTVSDMESDPD